MRLLIMGAGALGSAAGGFMARAGHEVAFAGRAAHVDAVRANGLRITGIWGEHQVEGIDAATDPNDLKGKSFDLVLVTVKSYDTARVADALVPLVDPDTLVCSYQNGLGNAEALASRFGWERVFGARAIYGVRMPAPGHVDVTVIAQPTALGVYDHRTPAKRVRSYAEAMDRAGLPTLYTERIETVLWSKVAYNCALNPLSALLDVPYGALAETRHTRDIIYDVVHELYWVGLERGVALEPGTPDGFLDVLYHQLIPPTASHYASMCADFKHEKRTEIDALNGAIARFGDELGIRCPANTLLTKLVHAREHGYGIAS